MNFFRQTPADLSVFHEFAPPPTGGGHQFMRALCRGIESRGLRIEYNRLSRGTPACLFNSYNFDFRKLARALRARPDVRAVHRLDGPLQTYRGMDDGTDARISEINHNHATATIFQSRFSLDAHLALGLSARAPVVIPNTPDPEIFHPRDRLPFDANRKFKLISVSWSDNPNKGLETYLALDTLLDYSRVEYTFVGRIQTTFRNIRLLAPMPSAPLADLLRQQDAYLTASRNDPCSNSLLEALACGLPALYLNSGGHPELAADAGLPFDAPEEVPAKLETLARDHATYRERIAVPSLDDTVDAYLKQLFPETP
ncbi:MAG: glycosyltransferase family 4 protein [Verrucomicrobia bacterium]|nr:glycosyltransferase family 4 protein [Verrucomicrobiota bacterium]